MKNAYRLLFPVLGLVVGLFLLSGSVLAQPISNSNETVASLENLNGSLVRQDLNPSITLEFNQVPLRKALKHIAGQAGAGLYYSAALVPDKTITLRMKAVPLGDALREVLEGTSLKVVTSGRNIVLRQKNIIYPTQFPVAQKQETITGTVTDASTGNTLPGVNIKVKGTTTGTSTDTNGNFELIVESLQDTLMFSYIGYQTRQVPINGRTTIDIEMQSQAITGQEMVVVGYGVQKSRDVTGAIASVDEDQLAQQSPTNTLEAIQGQISGVQITPSSGAPGEGAMIRIRGTSTFSSGVNPLYIVDGQPRDNIDYLNPNNIKSVEILKDGASAAIYGSRSANGVVIVTTKTAEEGETNINASYLRSYSKVRFLPVMNTNQRFEWEEFRGKGPEGIRLDRRNQLYNANINLQAKVTRVAPRDEFNVNFSNGDGNTNYYWNLGYLNEDGVMITTNNKRLNSSLNVNHQFSEKISVGIKSDFSYKRRNNIDGFQSGFQFNNALWAAPWSIIYGNNAIDNDKSDQLLMYYQRYQRKKNPIGVFTRRTNIAKHYVGNIFTNLQIDFLDNLTYTAQTGVNLNFLRGEYYYPVGLLTKDDQIQGEFNSGLDQNWIHESFFNFNDSFGDHELSATAGLSFEKWNYPQEQTFAFLASELLPTLNNAQSIDLSRTYTLDQDNHALQSFFGRVRYSYQNKYILTGTFRRDGSSRFARGSRWANFPSISLAWRFSSEPFMDGTKSVDDAKIRVSYARNGNERIGNRDYLTKLETGHFYKGVSGVGTPSRLGNPEIRWEETEQFNTGLDLDFLEGRLNFTIDYYYKNTTGLLANRLMPAYSGANDVKVNAGSINNQGIEFSIEATPYDREGVRWHTNFNFSTNTNKVTEIEGGTPIINSSHITKEGSAVASFYGYTKLGVFAYDESNAFTNEGEQLTPNFDDNSNFINYTLNGNVYQGNVNKKTVGGITSGGGDYNYNDLDGDFQITGQDREVLGNPYPKYYGGFRNTISYNNINFSFLFGYQFGGQIYNRFGAYSSQFQYNAVTPAPWVFENRWMGPGDETARFAGGPNRPQDQLGASTATSEWIESSDFIKLRNVKLSYNLPSDLISRVDMSRLTVYTSVNNALVWTNYRGRDPEVTPIGDPLNIGVDWARYPSAREFIFGVNIQF